MKKLLADANNILATQGLSGNWDYDPYMHGLYNGMELIVSIFEKREPKFRNTPEQWLCDNKSNSVPIEQV